MDDYVIKCGTLIDGTGREPVKDAKILIRNNRIARIEQKGGTDLDNFPNIVDASNKTVLPGIIDSHKHVLNCGGDGVGVGLTVAQAKENIHQIYKGGVTSVLDLGSANIIELITKLPQKQPKIFYAITILTCPNGYPGEYMDRKFYKMGSVAECETESDIKKAIKKLYKKGVSTIKTAVVTRTFDGRPQVCWTDKQLQALTDEAHSYGLKVCAHITYKDDYAQAARCGIDSIHHAAFDGKMYEKDLDDMINKGIVFVPTLSLIDLMVTGLKENWINQKDYNPPVSDAIKENMRNFTKAFQECPDDKPVGNLFVKVPKEELCRIPEIQLENVKEYIKRGGTVAMGTDSSLGFSLHTTPVREIELLAEAGLSNVEAIKASTLTAASVFGKENEIGSIETGKLADILVVNGDVAQNLSALNNTEMVFINGKKIYHKD
ncbi:MAG: amidohydrolase family protein [Spirochaetales bacterium]|nr:amidohydrolase family protein [Spirochaetales bacterium]